MKSFKCTLLLSAMAFGVMAQDKFAPGLYVTPGNDTVRGYIDYRHNYGTGIYFRPAPKTKARRLTPDSVRTFRFGEGPVYESIPISIKKRPPVPLFVNIMISGEVDLYLYQRNFIVGSDEHGRFNLIRTRSSNDMEALKNYQANTGAFNILFQDCPAVKEEAQKVFINDPPLRELIRHYHGCKGADYLEFPTPKGKRLKYVGVFAGQTMSTLTFDSPDAFSSSSYLSNATFSKSSELTFGALALISSREPSPVVSFETGLSFSKGDFNGTFVYENNVGGYDIRQTSETTMSYSRLSVSAGVRFTARSNRLNPYASLGVAMQHFLSLESNVHQTTEINDSVEEEDFPLNVENNTIAMWGAAGLKLKVAGKHAIFLDVHYEYALLADRGSITTIAPRIGFLF